MSTQQFCTLYLDASGDTGWTPPYGRSKLRWYVVAGIALTPEADLQADKETDRILREYVPSSEWNSPKFELCLHDLHRGDGVYSTLDHPTRWSMANEVLNLILHLRPTLFATAIDKLRMKQKYGVNAIHPRSLGTRATIHRYAMSLARRNMIGSVRFDEEDYRKDLDLQQMVRTFKRSDIIIRGSVYQPRHVERIDKILDVSVASSTMTPGIQLADFCARWSWLHFERGKSDRFNQLSPLWDRDKTRIYEPSTVPK